MPTIKDLLEKLHSTYDSKPTTNVHHQQVLDIVYQWDRQRKNEYKQKMTDQKQDDENLIIPFGKYKGRNLYDIIEFDKPYLSWMYRQDSFSAVNYPNLYSALSEHM